MVWLAGKQRLLLAVVPDVMGCCMLWVVSECAMHAQLSPSHLPAYLPAHPPGLCSPPLPCPAPPRPGLPCRALPAVPHLLATVLHMAGPRTQTIVTNEFRSQASQATCIALLCTGLT